ncbi:hypothetical protein ANN_07477 [Periplaneta americana]|uniref:RNase H type-1 domain-containing protein n=1 Tax=Periplaneta americana TaxID=6978 RepID=A0ABQ8T0A0_PERAM|nr:hypothetical protein ANN_07477 [Periplaneta americana]
MQSGETTLAEGSEEAASTGQKETMQSGETTVAEGSEEAASTGQEGTIQSGEATLAEGSEAGASTGQGETMEWGVTTLEEGSAEGATTGQGGTMQSGETTLGEGSEDGVSTGQGESMQSSDITLAEGSELGGSTAQGQTTESGETTLAEEGSEVRSTTQQGERMQSGETALAAGNEGGSTVQDTSSEKSESTSLSNELISSAINGNTSEPGAQKVASRVSTTKVEGLVSSTGMLPAGSTSELVFDDTGVPGATTEKISSVLMENTSVSSQFIDGTTVTIYGGIPTDLSRQQVSSTLSVESSLSRISTSSEQPTHSSHSTEFEGSMTPKGSSVMANSTAMFEGQSSEGQETFTSVSLGYGTTSFDGEIIAISGSLRNLLCHISKFKNAVILSDSKAAILSIVSKYTPSPQTAEITKMLSQLISLNKRIVFQCIPSHCGILGNENADALAKKGSTATYKSVTKSTYYSVKRFIKSTYLDFNKQNLITQSQGKKWNSLHHNPQLLPDLPRKSSVAAFRLSTGHDCLAKHLHRIGIYQSPICPLCNPNQEMDSEHHKICASVADHDNIFEKYWSPRGQMTLLSLPSKETLRGHSDSSFRGEVYIQCCVGVRLCAMYSNQELAEIHFMYCKADGNAALARRLYQERYPQQQCPDRKTFVCLHYRLCEYGKFNSPGLGRGRPRSTTPEVQEEILEAVNMTPSSSIRRVALQVNYHLQRVQVLSPADYPARVRFCQWFLQQCGVNPNFPALVLFTDEAQFTRDGIINFHYQHVWAYENPHATVPSHHQVRFSLNMWASIIGDRLVGPHALVNRLTGQAYTNFLENIIPHVLENTPLINRQHIHFLHDGAPAHFSRTACRYLDRRFPDRWIGRGGPIAWPPRSPDLNPLDFYLWGHLKSLVYSSPVPDLESLRNRIVACSEDIRNTPGVWDHVRRSMRHRCEVCIQAGGGHFEHLLRIEIPHDVRQKFDNSSVPDGPRKDAVAIYRMTTGHDCLALHLHRLSILPSSVSPLCQVENTINDTLNTALETINTRYPTEEWLHIYTDGSTTENLTGAGVACTHFSLYHSVGRDTTNYDGEIEAIHIALRQLLNLPLNKYNKAVILSDSKAAIQGICSNATKKSTKIRECYKMLTKLQKVNKIVHLQWIPAHCGVMGNETADTLAKKGTTIKQKSKFNFSYSSIKRLITTKFSHSYLQEIESNAKDKKWITLLSNPDIIPQRPRKTAAAAFRLLTNHDCLASHLYRIGISASPICVLCNDPAEINEDHLKTCEALRSEETTVQKYWKAQLLMASLPNARH